MRHVLVLSLSFFLSLLISCTVSSSGVDAQVASDAASSPDRARPDAASPDSAHDAGQDAALPDSARPDQQAQGTCGLRFDPDPLVFTAQRINGRVDLTVNLINDSDSDVAVTSISIGENTTANEFAVASDSPFTGGLIPAGDIGNSRGVKVSYTPRDALPDTGFLRVMTACADNPMFQVELDGDFASAPAIVVTSSADVATPMVSEVDFGQIGQGLSGEATLFIKNVQPGSALTVEGVVLDPSTGTDFRVDVDRGLAYTLSAWDSFCGGTQDCDTGRQEVCVGGACRSAAGPYIDQVMITLHFNPQDLSEQWANLRVHSDDQANPLVTVTLHGIGVAPQDCPERPHAPGYWNETQHKCIYTCSTGWVDQNGDLQDENNSDGCESNCVINNALLPDQPDMDNIDANCDGMDGDPAEGFFVDLYAGSGGDGSKALPFNNLQAGIDAAANSYTKKKVFIAGESFTLEQSLQLPDGVSLFGGYSVYGQPDSEKWKVRTDLTVFNGPNPAIVADGLSRAAVLQKISVNGGPGTAVNKNAVAFKAVNSPNLQLEGMTLKSGHAFSGSNGTAGSNGAVGTDAQAGLAGCNESTCNFWDDAPGCQGCKEGGTASQAPACATAGSGGAGGPGGFVSYSVGTQQTLVTLHDGVISASGKYLDSAQRPFARDDDHDSFVDDISGYIVEISGATHFGNNGRFTITEQMSDTRVKLGNAPDLSNESNLTFSLIQQFGAIDGAGNAAGTVAGGSGGDRAGNALYSICYGADGADGADGRYGDPGAGGSSLAAHIVGSDLLSGDGADGTAGAVNATGAAGGGGGAGGDCGDYHPTDPSYGGCTSAPQCGHTGWGGGGGAGGSAGCAGGAGTGGGGGGSSVAILAINSPIDVIDCTLITGDAANGGAGGAGGQGGAGGAGAAGGAGTATSGSGGAGGHGGHGAYGGGGAGGAGGDCVGIAYSGQAPVQSGVNNFTLGTAGTGGAGGDAAPAGYCQHNDSSDCGQGQNGPDGRRENVLAL